MKVELSIKDDKELRNTIKDMIKGCIRSIAREEIQKIASEELQRKVLSRYNERVIDEMYKDCVKKEIKNILGTQWGQKGKVRERAELLIQHEVGKFKKFLDKQKEKIKESIKNCLKQKGIDIGNILE